MGDHRQSLCRRSMLCAVFSPTQRRRRLCAGRRCSTP
nr:MAG TPA: hypothetical protein [Bacteriophage sp.]